MDKFVFVGSLHSHTPNFDPIIELGEIGKYRSQKIPNYE